MTARSHRFLRLVSFHLAIAALCLAPTARAASLAVPATGAKLQAFVPAGWAIESKLEGDLDGDGKADTVLVLLEKEKKDEEDDRRRALVVLLRRADGWAVGGTNVGLVYGWQLAGVNGGDAAPELAISARGVLDVSQYGGSRQAYGSVHRFRWNRERAKLELIGLDESSRDRLSGAENDRSCNLLTGVCVETATPAQQDEDGNAIAHPPSPTRKTTRPGKKPLLALEDVSLEH
jgi:hypothetical protein